MHLNVQNCFIHVFFPVPPNDVVKEGGCCKRHISYGKCKYLQQSVVHVNEYK